MTVLYKDKKNIKVVGAIIITVAVLICLWLALPPETTAVKDMSEERVLSEFFHEMYDISEEDYERFYRKADSKNSEEFTQWLEKKYEPYVTKKGFQTIMSTRQAVHGFKKLEENGQPAIIDRITTVKQEPSSLNRYKYELYLDSEKVTGYVRFTEEKPWKIIGMSIDMDNKTNKDIIASDEKQNETRNVTLEKILKVEGEKLPVTLFMTVNATYLYDLAQEKPEQLLDVRAIHINPVGKKEAGWSNDYYFDYGEFNYYSFDAGVRISATGRLVSETDNEQEFEEVTVFTVISLEDCED